MATGFGIDPTLNTEGVPTSGTSSKDIRNITAGIYTTGVISGGVVTTSASSMAYTVSAGVAAFPVSAGETVLGPIPSGTISTQVAPSSGTRTEIIYAVQGIPSVDGHSNIVLGVGTVLPARAVELDRRIVPATVTNTNSTQRTGSVRYSIPYGASLGVLHSYRDTRSGQINHARTVVNTKSIYVPTDRQVRISIISSMNSLNAGPWDASQYCTVGYDVMLNNVYKSHFQTGGLDRARQTFHFSDIYQIIAGTHTFKFEMLRIDGPGYPVAHYGSGWGGTFWTIEDIGPII